MPKTTHEFQDLATAAKEEIKRDAPRLAQTLDLTADAEAQSEAEMVDMVRRNWADPMWRMRLVAREKPERVVGLFLQAHDVRLPDGSPLTPAAYHQRVLKPLLAGQPTAFDAPPLTPLTPPAPPAPQAPTPTLQEDPLP